MVLHLDIYLFVNFSALILNKDKNTEKTIKQKLTS